MKWFIKKSPKESEISKNWKIGGAVLTTLVVLLSVPAWVQVRTWLDEERFLFIDQERHQIDKVHYLSTLEPLRRELKNFVATQAPNTSVYIEYLNTGAHININDTFHVFPASLLKVPLALAVMKIVEEGGWALTTEFVMTEGDKNPISSLLHRSPAGTRFSIQVLLEAMLTESDNTAYQILLRNLPSGKIEALREAIGLEELFSSEGKISAREYSRLMRSLYTANYLSRESAQYLLDILDKATFKDFLRKDIPEDVHFPHKFSLNPDFKAYGDAGVVYLPNRPYLIVVLYDASGDADESAASKAASVMRYISKVSYEYFSTAKNNY